MPAGLSWARYITLMTVSLAASLAGAQVVHLYYRPLDDLEELVEQELRKRKLRKMKSNQFGQSDIVT